MSLTGVLKQLDHQVAPSREPLLPGNNVIYSIVGKKGTGKSTLLLALLNSKLAFKQRFNYIWMVSPTARGEAKFQKLVEELDEHGRYHETLNEGIMDQILREITAKNERWNKKKEIRHLIILDDCMADLPRSKQAILSRIIVTSRHLHCSVIITSQKYNAIPTVIRAQNDLLSIFKTYNTREIQTIQEDMSIDRDLFTEIYDLCTDEPHSFMHVNLLTNPITFYKRFDELHVDFK